MSSQNPDSARAQSGVGAEPEAQEGFLDRSQNSERSSTAPDDGTPAAPATAIGAGNAAAAGLGGVEIGTGIGAAAAADWDDGPTTVAGTLRKLVSANEAWTGIALILIMAFFTIRAPGKFLTTSDLSNISANAAPLLVMAIGQTFVILTAGIDLSVGSVLVLAGVVAGEYYQHQPGAGLNASWGVILVGLLIAIAVGTAFGTVQGFVIAKAKVPPLITTLAGLLVAEGFSYLITNGSDIRSVPTRLSGTIGLGSIGGVPWLVVISFALALVFGLILAYTGFGRYTYAVGSNPEAALRAGIKVDRHLIKVYALQGLLSGAAGLLSLAYFGTSTISGHSTDNLTVITAVVLGGASLFGGRGSMFGTVLGVFIPAMLLTGLVILAVNQYWQYVAIGLVLGAAVYLDQFRRRLRERS
ncbi:MAG TPA: ABC transporter permease [Actinocrinis sp.]|nr:ABC transporter permease [Actinocrinis sp.]